MHDIIILASGPSVKKYNLRGLENRGHLIAISGAALYTKPEIALSMDRKVSEFCYPLWCIQGIPQIYLRACTVKNFKAGTNAVLFQHDGPDTKMTDDPFSLNGSNTGTCALNLAYQKRPDRVFLLGYDMQRGENNEPYWHPPYEWNMAGAVRAGTYAAWAQEFTQINEAFRAKDIDVYNVTHRSLITAFDKISYDSFLEMTR